MSGLCKSANPVTRRELLRLGALGLAMVNGLSRLGAARADRPRVPNPSSMVKRPDLLDEAFRDQLELIQLTTDPEVGGSHIYMEAPIFAPDSKRFVLQRSGHAHGSDRNDPHHRFLLCDIEDGCALHPLTDELGTTGPAISPDGRYFYYFVDDTARKRGGRALLKRVNLDGTDRQTLFVIDHKLPGTSFRPSRFYPLSTIASDGRRLAISARLAADRTPVPYGLMVFDLERATVELILHGPSWANTHPQYCRSTDPVLKRDILIQENHHRLLDLQGRYIQPPVDSLGVDIHVIRDDGTNFRDLPWGRDGNEFCQGHQCWRGRTGWAITSTQVRQPPEAGLIESLPVPAAGHVGRNAPGGIRNQLSREFPKPRFHHFATDLAGRRFITDFEPFTPAGTIMTARLGEPGKDPLADWRCIARPRCSGDKTTHMHPFLSPDGSMAFFNSDESGRLQAYMIRGLAQ